MKNPILSLIATSILVCGCSTGLKEEDDPGPSPVSTVVADTGAGSASELYQNARALLVRGQFESALSNFENLEATHPFSEHAAQARLDISYAYYRLNEHQSAIAAADRFLKLYPQHEKADYAYFLKGLSNFTRGRTMFENLVPRKMHQLDQSALRLASNDFASLVNRFPNSEYLAEAKSRMQVLSDAMARYELSTAEYYFGRSAMVATINRVNTMLTLYPDSKHKADGLALLARAHLAMGNRDLAVQTVQSLQATQPDHPDLKIIGNIAG